jgi:hypothetical protein
MADKLPALGTRIGKSQPVGNVVESTLQQDKQIGTGNSALPLRSNKKQMKLLLGKTIHAFDFLLFSQLDTVIRRFSSATFTVLSRRIPPPVKGTFI